MDKVTEPLVPKQCTKPKKKQQQNTQQIIEKEKDSKQFRHG